MRKSPIKVKLQYFPSSIGRNDGLYKIVRIDGAPNLNWHPKTNDGVTRLGDALNEAEANTLSRHYYVTTVI